jgi:type II secretory pathway component GspD/PulD (secretin)
MNVSRSVYPLACAKRLAGAFVIVSSFWGGVPLAGAALAAPLELPDGVYPYSVLDQDVTGVLREFGQNLGLRVKLSPKVSGTVKGKLPRLSAREFLDHICQMYGLEWYFDGGTLHISSVSEDTTRFLPLHGGLSVPVLIESLKGLSFYDARYPIRAGVDNASVIVTGPPVYAALVEQTFLMQGGAPKQTLIYRAGSVSVEKFGAEAAR